MKILRALLQIVMVNVLILSKLDGASAKVA